MAIKGNTRYANNLILISYLDSPESPKRRAMSILIRDACMIPYYKYTNWIKCKTALEPLYCKKIEEVTGKKMFNLI